MKIPTFRSVKIEERAVNQFQNNAQLVLDALSNTELLDYVLMPMKLLGSGVDNRIEHGFGRPARGYIVTRADKIVVPYTSPNDKNSKTTLILCASDTAEVTLLIF